MGSSHACETNHKGIWASGLSATSLRICQSTVCSKKTRFPYLNIYYIAWSSLSCLMCRSSTYPNFGQAQNEEFEPFEATSTIWCSNFFSRSTLLEKQDGSHEPECIHVLGLRVKTSAIGKRAFFSCIVRAYRLSEGTWSTVHKRQLMHKDTHRKHRLKTVHISPVTSLQCGVESVECGVESVEWVWSAECEV